MPKERKFNLVPLIPKQRISIGIEPYVKIFSNGVMQINKKSVFLGLGESWNSKFFKFFCDIDERMLAWKMENEMSSSNGARFIKIRKTKLGQETLNISVKNFIKSLDDVNLPTPRLIIKKYKDTDDYLQIGEVYYVIIPRQIDKL